MHKMKNDQDFETAENLIQYINLGRPVAQWRNLLKKNPDDLPLPQPVVWTDETLPSLKPAWDIPQNLELEYLELHEIISECEFLSSADLKRIETLCKEAPQSPYPRNLLIQAYRLMRFSKKEHAHLQQLLQDFPEYFFAWLDQGASYFNLGQSAQLLDHFGKHFEIYEHTPKRLYHVSEVITFYMLSCVVLCHHKHLWRAAYAAALVYECCRPLDGDTDKMMRCLWSLQSHFSEQELLLLHQAFQRKLRKLKG